MAWYMKFSVLFGDICGYYFLFLNIKAKFYKTCNIDSNNSYLRGLVPSRLVLSHLIKSISNKSIWLGSSFIWNMYTCVGVG